MNEAGFFMEKPGDHVIFVQIVEVLLNSAFIHRFGGSDGYRFTVNVYGFFQMNRIDPMQRFTQSSLLTEKPHLLGFEKQLVSEIRMRNTDHGHGTFLQTFTE